jgi:hypothetical protein
MKHFPALAIQQPPFVYKQDEVERPLVRGKSYHFAIHNKSVYFIILKGSEDLLLFPSIEP